MATKASARTRILERLSRQGSPTALLDEIDEELAIAQEELEEGPERPWFTLSERATYELTVGEPRVPRPEDFLMEYEAGCLWLDDLDDNEKCLSKEEFEALVPPSKETEDQGEPEAYALVGPYFWLDKPPDKQYKLRMLYYAAQTDIRDLSDSQTNEWLTHAPGLLIAMAGHKVAQYRVKDFEAAKMFMQERDRQFSLLRSREQALRDANRSYVMRGK